MQYKALFLDIDDTLLTHPRPISPGNLAAIRRAQAAGMLVTIATGRTYLGATPVWQALNVRGPVIVYGGAMAINTLTGEPLFLDGVPRELVQEVLEYCHEVGAYAQLYDRDVIVTEQETDFTRLYCSRQNLSCRIEPALRSGAFPDTPKVLVYVDPAEEARYTALFTARFGGRLEIAASQPGYIELNRIGTNKGTAILRVAELMGIRKQETAAAGDNTLDLEMLRMAGLSACVQNGQQVVKEASDLVIPACDEDGVAWFIENHLL